MDLIKKIWTARKLILVVMIPLSLLPLPLIHPCSESSCAYVLIVTAVYWVSEAVPLGAAALVPAFLYPLFGVLKSSEVASEYFKDTTLLLMGVICLAASIEKWNLHKRIALRMVMIAGAKPGMLVLGFMCCTVFLSMWLSNTSTTAMVMPIAEAVLQQLICTGIADSLEDSVTVDTQDEESDKEENQEPSKNHLELLDRKHNEKHEVCMLNEAPISIPAPPKKPQIRRDSQYPTNRDHMICKCLSLSITYAATIGGLITITGTSTNLIFAEQFNKYVITPHSQAHSERGWDLFKHLIQSAQSHFLTCIGQKCQLSYKKKLNVYIYIYKFFFLLTKCHVSRRKGYRTDATVSVLLGFLLFLIPARKPWTSAFSSESKGQIPRRCLQDMRDPLAPMITWKDFQRLMPWEIVILVGGGYALAAGCKVSGLSMWIGRQLEPMSGLPPWAVTLLACLLVSAVTEFASNPATLTVFLPILSALSETLHINPLHTLIPATMCVSFGVMLPVGNPPNAIVFSYGHVQISDMVKAGFGVNLIGVFVVMLAIMTWGEPLFHLSEFPTWALMRNVTGSL
uniref:Solute carrier family 13 member 4-like n=1 Tax=Sinocyclocheilus rhinocerous TaxID=307959 RepID=A0A673IAG1_9TELE